MLSQACEHIERSDRGDTGEAVRHIGIEWGPTIDAEACDGCGVCIGFCHNDVYRWSKDESQVVIAFKTHCVPGCSHCGTLCEAEAISFPTLEDIKHARRGE